MLNIISGDETEQSSKTPWQVVCPLGVETVKNIEDVSD